VSSGGNAALALRAEKVIAGIQTFPVLVEAISCYFKGKAPDIAWISQA